MLDSPWLTPKDVARLTGSSTRSVQRWCDEARPHVRAIRIRSSWRIHASCLGVATSSLPQKSTFRIGEVADWLRISRHTIYRLIATGELQTITAHGLRRIRRTDVLALIERAADTEAA